MAWCVAGAPATPAAAATTTITVNGTQGGRTFDGIGAISGGGGNTRLLTDYPAAQQQTVSLPVLRERGMVRTLHG